MADSQNEDNTNRDSNSLSANPNRREFLAASAGSLALSLVENCRLPAAEKVGTHHIPEDKNLSKAWVDRLFAKGQNKVYKGEELTCIGMPIGGICAGQLYLGGDGKLWHWDIFNQHIGTGDGHYAHPLKPRTATVTGNANRCGNSAILFIVPPSGWAQSGNVAVITSQSIHAVSQEIGNQGRELTTRREPRRVKTSATSLRLAVQVREMVVCYGTLIDTWHGCNRSRSLAGAGTATRPGARAHGR